jgi:hypothetical protein
MFLLGVGVFSWHIKYTINLIDNFKFFAFTIIRNTSPSYVKNLRVDIEIFRVKK